MGDRGLRFVLPSRDHITVAAHHSVEASARGHRGSWIPAPLIRLMHDVQMRDPSWQLIVEPVVRLQQSALLHAFPYKTKQEKSMMLNTNVLLSRSLTIGLLVAVGCGSGFAIAASVAPAHAEGQNGGAALAGIGQRGSYVIMAQAASGTPPANTGTGSTAASNTDSSKESISPDANKDSKPPQQK